LVTATLDLILGTMLRYLMLTTMLLWILAMIVASTLGPTHLLALHLEDLLI